MGRRYDWLRTEIVTEEGPARPVSSLVGTVILAATINLVAGIVTG